MTKQLTQDQYLAMKQHKENYQAEYARDLAQLGSGKIGAKRRHTAWENQLTMAWLNDWSEQRGILRRVRNDIGIQEALTMYAEMEATAGSQS